VLALPVLLAGCATSEAAVGSTQATTAGGTTGSTTGSTTASDAGGPPETAAMVCGDEIRDKVQQVLALPDRPATESRWADSTLTCTYRLPMGPMTLTVQVLPGAAQAHTALDTGRAAIPGAHDLAGLGELAYGDDAGRVGVLKDAEVLTVDTTALPVQFGVNEQKRTDLAFEVASDVLGCWTGDGDE
jgi:hypothetical protein